MVIYAVFYTWNVAFQIPVEDTHDYSERKPDPINAKYVTLLKNYSFHFDEVTLF